MFFHSNGIWGCTAVKVIPLRTSSLVKEELSGNFSQGNAILFGDFGQGKLKSKAPNFSDFSLGNAKLGNFSLENANSEHLSFRIWSFSQKWG